MIFFLNAINLVTVLFGFLVQILIVRYFGASDSTDIYYLIVSIITFVTSLSTGFLTDLFVPIYHDAKKRGFENAQRLTGSVLTLAFFLGLLLSAVVYFLAPAFVSIFASGFPHDKALFAVSMLRIIAASILFTTFSLCLNATLNANSFFLLTYLTNLITPAFNLLGLFVGGARYGIAALMYATVFSSMTIAGILFIYCKFKVGARFASPFGQRDLNFLLIKNLPVRGSNVVTLLRGPLTTTVLSYFPAGILTLYSYAEKIINVLVGTTNSPLAQVYYTKSSEFASKKDYPSISGLLVHTVQSSAILFAGLFFVTAIMFQKAFGIIFTGKVTPDGIRTMFLLLLALYPYYYATLLGTELGATGLAMKKGRLNFYASVVFVVVLAIFIFPLVKGFSMFGLPVSLFLAQVSSSIVYVILINRIGRLVGIEFIRVQLNTIVVSILVIVAGLFTAGNVDLQILLDSILLVVWIATSWRDAVNAMKLLTAKGEVK